MRLVWGTISRSGSQFLVGLTTHLLGTAVHPQSRISGARREGYKQRDPSFEELLSSGRALDYFTVHRISALKLEDPTRDDFGAAIAAAFPGARWLTSVRSIEAILTSHHNIKKWGHDESYVLASYRSAIALFEELHRQHRLLMVDIERPSRFVPETFAKYLGAPASTAFIPAVKEWRPVNDLAYQKEKWGEAFHGVPERPAHINRLRDLHPWLEEIEGRYHRLIQETWELHA